MRVSLWAALGAAMLLAGCESRYNPANWFGRDEPPPVTEEAEEVVRRDPRPSIDQVISLRSERVPGGALVTAVGLPPTQGWFAAALIPEATDIADRPVPENGVLSFRFVVVPPQTPQQAGTQASREVTVGTFLPDSRLAGVRSIVVKGERSQRSTRP